MLAARPDDALDSPRGWLITAAATVSMFTVFGVGYSFGAFFESITADFGSGSGATAVVFSVTISLSFLLGPYTGALADRVGPRPVLLGGAVSLAAGLLLTTIVPTITLAYVCYGIGVGVAIACGYVPMVAVVGSWFVRQRALALGVSVAGIGLGTLVANPMAAFVIGATSWRTAFVVFAIVGASLLVIVSFVARPGPATEPAATRRPLRELWKIPDFRVLYLAGLVVAFGLFVPFVFIATYAEERGSSEVAAALLVGLIGGASVVGRLVLGGMADRVGAARLFRFTFLLMASSQLLWLLSDGNYALLVMFTLAYGAGYGGYIAISPAVAATRFGLKGLGGLLGTWYTSAATGALLGPPVAGLVVDEFGYPPAIALVGAACLGAWIILHGLRD